jgi:hypothetical protein
VNGDVSVGVEGVFYSLSLWERERVRGFCSFSLWEKVRMRVFPPLELVVSLTLRSPPSARRAP